MNLRIRAARILAAVVVLVGIVGVPAPASRAAGQVDYSGVIATLEQTIPQVMQQTGAVGMTIALVDGDRTVWTHGFGYADLEAKKPVTPTTMFMIGSASKTMTAAAIMQLVQEGQVDLDAPISRYVPELRLRPRFADSTITIRSIMTHHSGIPGDVRNLAEFGATPDRDMYDKVIKQLSTMLPEGAVGDAWSYSNLGITMLQGVIQNVTGQSFIDYTNQHLFTPMGMKATTFDDSGPFRYPMARSYVVLPNEDGTTTTYRRPREYINIMPAGSVVSNAVDMATYLKTMIRQGKAPNDNRILKAATVRQMITPQATSPLDITFFKPGLVWWIGYTQPWTADVVNHGGDTTFFHSMAAFQPKDGVGVFVSTNTRAIGSPRDIVWQLAMRLMIEAKTGKQLPNADVVPAPEVPADPAQLAAMAGTYANRGGLVKVAADNGALQFTASAQQPTAQTRTLTLRADGWYCPPSVADGSCFQPQVIDGQRTLLARAPQGWTALYAQAIPADYSIPDAWRNRVGTYVVSGVSKGIHPDSDTTGATGQLHIADGVLMLVDQVLVPVGPNRAFTFGPTPGQVMREAGSALEAHGNKLTFLGITMSPVKG